MKASKFPREYRLYLPDEEVRNEEGGLVSMGIFLVGEQITARGFTLTGDGLPYYNQMPFECYVQWWSGFVDKNHEKVYEGDICSFEISSGFGSMIEQLAVMRWDAGSRQFILHMGAQQGGIVYDAINTVKVGNEFTNPDLLAKIIEKAKTVIVDHQ